MKKSLNFFFFCIYLLGLEGFPLLVNAQKPLAYPPTPRENVVDVYFGTKVEDPYRWLEYDTAQNVKDWIKAQNKVTFEYLSQIPYREKIKKRLNEIYNYAKYSAPQKVGEYYFFFKKEGLQNQAVLYYQKGLKGKPEVFLDPNAFSKVGTIALADIEFSGDNKYIAYSISRSGSDWREICVMEVATKRQLPDTVKWVKFSKTAWYKDGFFYTRYEEPQKGKEFSSLNQFSKIYYHKLGTPQAADILIYEDPKNPLRYHFPEVTEDEKYLIINVSEGTSGSQLLYKDLQKPNSEVQLLLPGFEYNYDVITNLGDKFLIRTNQGAENYHLVSVDPKRPQQQYWLKILPEKKDLLQAVSLVGGNLYAIYLHNATTQVLEYSLEGKLKKEIQLPGLGTAVGFGGKIDSQELFYTFSSFTSPPSIYRLDIPTGKSEIFIEPPIPIDVKAYETKQVFYKSKDGTSVPMFIVHKKGLKYDGKNPTYLYGYGGFNISLTPNFNILNYILLENNGVYAVANLRGGGEYGEAWHKAGMLEKKQNVFDDFIAAAEYLIKQKITSPEKLAIAGSSNGGLLVGACMTQRPDLFKVAFP
ncbi:MAG: prolyl oligopeptidase family serine peptidase, partial [Bacteroidia bacterium]|nr:prolyl oligopeptidase family serine peptidase [Bacteroidia bacterium]